MTKLYFYNWQYTSGEWNMKKTVTVGNSERLTHSWWLRVEQSRWLKAKEGLSQRMTLIKISRTPCRLTLGALWGHGWWCKIGVDLWGGPNHDEGSEGWWDTWMRNLDHLGSDPGSVTCQVPLVRQVPCFLEPGLFHLLPGVRMAVRICATKDTWALWKICSYLPWLFSIIY